MKELTDMLGGHNSMHEMLMGDDQEDMDMDMGEYDDEDEDEEDEEPFPDDEEEEGEEEDEPEFDNPLKELFEEILEDPSIILPDEGGETNINIKVEDGEPIVSISKVSVRRRGMLAHEK